MWRLYGPVRPSICLSVCLYCKLSLVNNIHSNFEIWYLEICDITPCNRRWKCGGSQLTSSQFHSFPVSHESSKHTWNHSYNPSVLFFVFLLTFGLSNAAVTSPHYTSHTALRRSEQSATQFEVKACHFEIRNADWAAGWKVEESKFYSREGQILFFLLRI